MRLLEFDIEAAITVIFLELFSVAEGSLASCTLVLWVPAGLTNYVSVVDIMLIAMLAYGLLSLSSFVKAFLTVIFSFILYFPVTLFALSLS